MEKKLIKVFVFLLLINFANESQVYAANDIGFLTEDL